MIDKVRSFILENALIDKNDKILIALSGGVDSMVLIDILLKLKDELGFLIAAVHFDHMIRETSSDDALFVKNYCEKNRIKIFMSKGDVKQCSLDEKLSLETAARKLRHSYIRHVAAEYGADKIAFAHHKNDRAETYLMRVLRGTGADGLGCMPEKDGMIIRPLLCAERKEVENYAKAVNLSWREDETNADTEYTRNNLRHKTLPHLIENYNESLINTLSNNARLMSRDRDYFDKETDKLVAKADETDNGYYLDDDSFLYLHSALLSRCIRRVIQKLGVKTDIYEINVHQVMELFWHQKTGATIHLPNEILARRDAFGVEIMRGEKAPPVFCETPLSLRGTTYVPECGVFSVENAETDTKKVKNHSKNTAFFDTITLSSNLTIRTRKKGDVFWPLGAPGSKSLKKYFIDKKISRFKRDYIPLVADENEILWIVGYEISDKVKITEDSIMIKKITFTKDKNKGDIYGE